MPLTQNFNSASTPTRTLVAAQYYRDINSYKLWNLDHDLHRLQEGEDHRGVTNLFDKATRR
jgi:iron complex outermembrane receptor protein